MSTRPSDAVWLLSVLSDGREHELSDIIRRSQDERGYGLTVHSRAAQLRPLLAPNGQTIRQRSERHNGRVRSYYQLASLEKPDASTSTVVGDLTSGSSNEETPSLFQIPESVRGAYGEAA